MLLPSLVIGNKSNCIVSLDGKPTEWSEKTFIWMTEKKFSWDELRTKEPPWFNPSEMFDFLSVMKARL